MGGVAATVPAAGEAEGVIQFARANNVTHIVIMATRAPRAGGKILRPDRWRRRSSPGRRDERAHVVPERGGGRQGHRQRSNCAGTFRRWSRDCLSRQLSRFSAAGAGRGACMLRQTLAVSNVALVLLVAVLASAVTFGLWPSLFACLICALAYNFFFLPPLYTFTIAQPENVVTLAGVRAGGRRLPAI